MVDSHDPLCPSSPCSCEPDEYGHQFECRWYCNCNYILKVREDERRQAVERVRVKKGKFPSTRLDWDTIVIAILDGTKLRLSKKELNEQS